MKKYETILELERKDGSYVTVLYNFNYEELYIMVEKPNQQPNIEKIEDFKNPLYFIIEAMRGFSYIDDEVARYYVITLIEELKERSYLDEEEQRIYEALQELL